MLNVAVVGYLSDIKGFEIVKKLVNAGHYNYFVFGDAKERLPCYVHGKYDGLNELPRLFGTFKIDVALLLSICNESYSFTLTECLKCGIPVIGSNRGAIGNRLKKYGGGYTVDPTNFDEITMLLNVIDNNKSLLNVTFPEFKSDYELCEEYRQIYDKVLE